MSVPCERGARRPTIGSSPFTNHATGIGLSAGVKAGRQPVVNTVSGSPKTSANGVSRTNMDMR
jgi:hypothetical protein